jgi:hypothetical protein
MNALRTPGERALTRAWAAHRKVRDLLARAFAIKRAIAPELADMPTTRARDIRPSKSAVV